MLLAMELIDKENLYRLTCNARKLVCACVECIFADFIDSTSVRISECAANVVADDGRTFMKGYYKLLGSYRRVS